MLQVYEPRRQARLGWRVWGEMLRELVQARELLWRLVWRDVVARYKQSVFGVAIGVASPLALMGVLSYLNRSRLLPVSGQGDVPYSLFVYLGLLPWQMLATGLTRATSSLVQAADLVGKVRFPRETLVLAAVGQAVFDFLLGLPVLAVLLVYHSRWPAWSVVLVPLVLAVQVVLISGLGLVLSLLNAALRDVGSALPVILLLWMFLTPVIYPPPESGALALLNWINPASALVASVRDLTLFGKIPMLGPLAFSTLVSLFIGPAGWWLFHRLEPKIAERV